MVARGDPLAQILESLCLLVEEHAPDVLASILLIEDGRLKHGGAPSLPKDYIKAVDGMAIGPRVGSCGAAAYFGKPIIVSDILNDPLWADYREAMLALSLHACWSTPILSSEGKAIGTFAMYYRNPRSPSRGDQEIIEQITDLAGAAIQQKLIEQRLLRSEAYLREAQRLSHTGSWARSWAMNPRPGEVIYCSEEMLRLWGFDPLQGRPSSEKFDERIHLEDRAPAHESFWQAVRRKADYVNDFRITLPDGTVRYIQAIGHPVLDASGEVLEYVGTAVDVTERKRAEEERDRRRQLEADLAHVNRVSTMGELTASLGHELNQPIAAAIANAYACLQWLKHDQPDLAEAAEAATRMINDARRAAGIIDRLRSFHRKGAPPRREPVEVNEVAAEMLMLLNSEADRYAIAMRTDLAPALPTVMADRVELQQVFMNLMLNGIEAMKERSGELIVKSERSADGQLLISVTDTGIGLPAGATDQMFKAFFTTKPQGTGMGLSISRRIVESHGGRLWASANSGPGATFYFTLPRATASSKSSAA
jgi:PAS domain S-box-containing protein